MLLSGWTEHLSEASQTAWWLVCQHLETTREKILFPVPQLTFCSWTASKETSPAWLPALGLVSGGVLLLCLKEGDHPASERWGLIPLVLFHLAERRGRAGSSSPAPLVRVWAGTVLCPELWQCCCRSRENPEPKRRKKRLEYSSAFTRPKARSYTQPAIT